MSAFFSCSSHHPSTAIRAQHLDVCYNSGVDEEEKDVTEGQQSHTSFCHSQVAYSNLKANRYIQWVGGCPIYSPDNSAKMNKVSFLPWWRMQDLIGKGFDKEFWSHPWDMKNPQKFLRYDIIWLIEAVFWWECKKKEWHARDYHETED